MTEWMGDGVDTPQTVTTTRAPAVLKTKIVREGHPCDQWVRKLEGGIKCDQTV